jgi:hypothetical protein
VTSPVIRTLSLQDAFAATWPLKETGVLQDKCARSIRHAGTRLAGHRILFLRNGQDSGIFCSIGFPSDFLIRFLNAKDS